ncbi:hypothetical protein LP421_10560 [Rhizobium sp. RCAM05350]|nr:hypothetical protein LP421_10560 [Rhizobium sp. RCAM05350]
MNENKHVEAIQGALREAGYAPAPDADVRALSAEIDAVVEAAVARLRNSLMKLRQVMEPEGKPVGEAKPETAVEQLTRLTAGKV